MQAHLPQTYYLCNTLPYPSSGTPWSSSQLLQYLATPTTELLLPYSQQDLALSHIPRYHPNTQFISPTSTVFLCQCRFSRVSLTTYENYFDIFFLLGGWLAHQACWLLAFWYAALLPAGTALPNHVRFVQTHACQWQSLAFSGNCHHAPNPIICGQLGCQDRYCSAGLT